MEQGWTPALPVPWGLIARTQPWAFRKPPRFLAGTSHSSPRAVLLLQLVFAERQGCSAAAPEASCAQRQCQQSRPELPQGLLSLWSPPEGPNPSSVVPLAPCTVRARVATGQAEEISALETEQSSGKSRGGDGSGVIGHG